MQRKEPYELSKLKELDDAWHTVDHSSENEHTVTTPANAHAPHPQVIAGVKRQKTTTASSESTLQRFMKVIRTLNYMLDDLSNVENELENIAQDATTICCTCAKCILS